MTTQVENFKGFLEEERGNGLVDVKFCVVNANTEDASVEQAAGIVMMAIDQYKKSESKDFADY